jgi:thioredoxin 1
MVIYLHEVTDANFEEEVLKSDVPVLVDFWMVWFESCRQVSAMVNMATYKLDNLKVCRMNAEYQRITAKKYGIDVDSVTTLLLFKKGEVVGRLTGKITQPDIEAWIKVHL